MSKTLISKYILEIIVPPKDDGVYEENFKQT
jgi:hypothetical protein